MALFHATPGILLHANPVRAEKKLAHKGWLNLYIIFIRLNWWLRTPK